MSSKLGALVVVVGSVLAVAALFGAWWSINAAGPGLQVSLDFGLFGAVSRVVDNGAQTVDAEDYSALPNMGRVMLTGALLLVAAIAAGLAGAAAALLGGSRPRLRKVGAISAFLGAILAFASILSVMMALPGALVADTANGVFSINGFWGSTSQPGGAITWGAGIGWYLAVIAGVLLMIGGALALMARAPAPTAPGYAPYGYPGYGAPAPGTPPAPGYAPPTAYAPGADYAPPPPAQAPPTPQPAPAPAPPAPPPAAPPAPPLAAAPPAPPPAAPGTCANCGTPLPGPVRFCPKCGTPQQPGP